MKIAIVLVMILCIILGGLAILIIKLRNRNYIKNFEEILKSVSNNLAFIGLVFTIVSLITAAIGILYTIKEPKVDIEFKTAHYMNWEDENGNVPLCLVQDEDGHIDYEIYQPNKWYISLSNSGNRTINKLTIEIDFSDLYFIDQHYDYNMINHIYEHGGYKKLERTIYEIDPGDDISLPYFPFEIAEIFKDSKKDEIEKLDSLKMTVDILINDKDSIRKEYNIDIMGNGFREGCYFEYYINGKNKVINDIESEFVELQQEKNDNYLLSKFINSNVYNLNIDETKSDKYKMLYDYYLSKLDCYNETLKEESKSNALFWGRIYYLCESNILEKEGKEKYSISDIENMVQNDLNFKRINNYNIYMY